MSKNLPRRLPKPPVGRFVVPGPDGQPYPVYADPPLTKEHLAGLVAAGASNFYRPDRRDPSDEGRIIKCPPDCEGSFARHCHTHGEVLAGEEAFLGSTNAEVIAIRLAERAANGSHEATVYFMDRMLGKPKQQNENLNINVSLDSYLDSLPDPEGEVTATDVTDVTPKEKPLPDWI